MHWCIKVAVSLAGSLALSFSFGQNIEGKWVTVDDETGAERSVVEVFERQGKIYGRIVKLFRNPGEDPDPVCEECDPEDSRFRKKIVGMEVIQGMEKKGGEFVNGTILDPKNGKVYKCKLWIAGSRLMVRGYWGPFYRTQSWKRLP